MWSTVALKTLSKSQFLRSVHTSSACLAGARYRESKGQERHINRFRVMADTADWSYLDGRPAPLNVKQKMRYYKQIEYNMHIQKMIHEIDTAREQYHDRIREKEETKQRIISSKLKSKARQPLKPKSGIVRY